MAPTKKGLVMRFVLFASFALMSVSTVAVAADEYSDTKSGYDSFAGLRGSLAFQNSVSAHDNMTPPNSVAAKGGVGGGGSVFWGTRLPYGFKAELELLYQYLPLSRATVNGASASLGGSAKVFAPMANVYWNLPLGDIGFHPFVGGGVGYAWNEIGVDQVVGINIPTVRNDDWRFAYNFMAGASIPMGSSTRMTAMYRWLHEDIDIACATGISCGGGLNSQSVNVGVEYDL
jgi:opacity protein-like surface antigen